MKADDQPDTIQAALADLASLLDEVREGVTAPYLRELASEFRAARDDAVYQDRIRLVLRLYSGMGSFQDMVLQTSAGVRPEQAEFARLRDRLFEEARQQLH